jgi:branched-chain amino acid transport system substrate-binding protein
VQRHTPAGDVPFPLGPSTGVRRAPRGAGGLRAFLALCLFGLLTSHPAEAGKRPALPADVEAAVASAPTNRAAAIARLESAQRGAAADTRPWISALLGEQLRISGDNDAARTAFVDALTYGGPDVEPIARMGMALIDATRALDSTTVHTLVSVKDSLVLDTQNAERFMLLAERAAAGAGGDVSTHAKRSLAFAKADPEVANRCATRLAAVGYGTAPATAAVRPATTTPAAPVKVSEDRLLENAVTAFADGNTEAARTALGPLATSTDPEIASSARLLLQTLDGPPVDAGKVGVLLPGTGRFASIGGQVKEAITDGWGQVAPVEALVYATTDGTAAGAVTALQQLVQEQHVIAVLGPLLTDETSAVVEEANRLGVPLIALSQALDDPSPWPWVFQSWLTPRQQIDALLQAAMGERQWKQFAIYAPTSNYGKTAADQFAAAVEERGGKIVIRVDYAEDTKTHGPIAAKLRQPDADPAAPAAWYDAIFIPDNANRVTLAAAGIAFAEISIGANRLQERPPATLIGLSGWNRQEMVTNGGNNLRGGIFTDVYVPPPTGTTLSWYPYESWREFTTRYKETTGRTPTSIEALASDAGRIAAGAFRTQPANRYAFREALLNLHPTSTITAATGFDPEHRTLQRKIAVISVEPTGFIPAGYE